MSVSQSNKKLLPIRKILPRKRKDSVFSFGNSNVPNGWHTNGVQHITQVLLCEYSLACCRWQRRVAGFQARTTGNTDNSDNKNKASAVLGPVGEVSFVGLFNWLWAVPLTHRANRFQFLWRLLRDRSMFSISRHSCSLHALRLLTLVRRIAIRVRPKRDYRSKTKVTRSNLYAGYESSCTGCPTVFSRRSNF